jgi:serine/threonine protein kinase
MHEMGLSHRDLKAANILWSPATKSFHFIDLVGAARQSQLSTSVRVRNLARLQVSFAQNPHLTRTDRLRFLSIYLCWALRGRAGWKDWWKKIAEASREKIEQNHQRGRPVA